MEQKATSEAKIFRLPVNGVELQVTEAGQGMPLIWMHGLLMNMSVDDRIGWLDWERLSQKYRVIRFDVRGHGQSTASRRSTDYTWKALAQDVLDLADQLELEKFWLGGISMGSATAMEVALNAPERVDGLLLGLPPAAWHTRTEHASVYNMMANLAAMGMLTRVLPRLLALKPIVRGWQEIADPGLSHFVNRTRCSLSNATYRPLLRGAALSDLPEHHLITQIKCPTLLLGWEDDAGHPTLILREIHSLLPFSEAFVIRDLAGFRSWTGYALRFLEKHQKP